MLRNQVIDPESPERKGVNPNLTMKVSPPEYEDPWYAASNDNSPRNDAGVMSGVGGMTNNGAYGGNSSSFGSGSFAGYGNDSYGNMGGYDDYENEPPLLEELGVNFDHVFSKTKAVVIPTSRLSESILEDADLAGPLFYCLALGMCLLMSGKVHFGYIYGFSVFGCFSMNAIINLLHAQGLDFWRTCSVLGYSLIPVIGLASLSILVDLRGTLGFILSFIAIFWSTFSSTRIFDAKLHLTEQYWLVAYPAMLLYSCFVLITIF